jgi:hypothetical protein
MLGVMAKGFAGSDVAASADDAKSVRRARHFLYGLGIAFVLLGFSLDMIPALASVAAPLAGRICAGIGAVILSAGRFGSDRLVRRCQTLLTGWF